MPNPLELLFRPFLKGPMFTEAQSGANQWAGRTTLNSGSATVTVSTTVIKSDSIVKAFQEGNANHGILFGQATINSGSTTVAVSNAALTTTSRVFLTAVASGTDQSSGAEAPIEVKSLGAGSMAIGFAGLQNPKAANTYVNYMVTPTDGIPAPIEVKSISEGNYFTLGRADGRAAARNEIVMWEIVNTTV